MSASNRSSKSSMSFDCACDIASASHVFDVAAPIIVIPYSSLSIALHFGFISMQPIVSLIISEFMDIIALSYSYLGAYFGS